MGKKYGTKSVMKRAEKESPGVFVDMPFTPLILNCDQQIILNTQAISLAIQQNLLRPNLAMGGARCLVDLASQGLIKRLVARLGMPRLHLSNRKKPQ